MATTCIIHQIYNPLTICVSRPPMSFLSVHYGSFGQRFHVEIYLGFQEYSTFRLVPSICFSHNIQVCCLQSVSLEHPVQTLLDTKIPTGRNPCTFRKVHTTPLNPHPGQGRPGVAPASPAANGEVRVSSHFWRQGADTRLSHRAAGPDMVGGPFPQSPARLLCRLWRMAGLSEWGQLHKSRGAIILFSIVMNTLACHAGDCGSVPRWDNLPFFFFFNPGAFKPWPHTPGPELCPALHALCSCFQSAKKSAHSALD